MTQSFKRQRKHYKTPTTPLPPDTRHWVRRIVTTEELDLHTLETHISWVISWYQKPLDTLGDDQNENKSEG